jgi:hypothetical protein
MALSSASVCADFRCFTRSISRPRRGTDIAHEPRDTSEGSHAGLVVSDRHDLPPTKKQQLTCLQSEIDQQGGTSQVPEMRWRIQVADQRHGGFAPSGASPGTLSPLGSPAAHTRRAPAHRTSLPAASVTADLDRRHPCRGGTSVLRTKATRPCPLRQNPVGPDYNPRGLPRLAARPSLHCHQWELPGLGRP